MLVREIPCEHTMIPICIEECSAILQRGNNHEFEKRRLRFFKLCRHAKLCTRSSSFRAFSCVYRYYTFPIHMHSSQAITKQLSACYYRNLRSSICSLLGAKSTPSKLRMVMPQKSAAITAVLCLNVMLAMDWTRIFGNVGR